MSTGSNGDDSQPVKSVTSVDLAASDDEKEVTITAAVETDLDESLRDSLSSEYLENSKQSNLLPGFIPNRTTSGSTGSDPFARKDDTITSIKDKLATMRVAAGFKLDAVQQTLGSFVQRKDESTGTDNVHKMQRALPGAPISNMKEFTLSFSSTNLPFEFAQSPSGSGIIIANTIESHTDILPLSEKPADGAFIVELNGQNIEDISLDEFKIRLSSLCEYSENRDHTDTIQSLEFKFRQIEVDSKGQNQKGSMFGNRVRSLANDIHQGGMTFIGGLGELFSQQQQQQQSRDPSLSESSEKSSSKRLVSGAVGFSKLLDVVIASPDAIPFTLSQRPGGENIIITAINEQIMPKEQQYASELDVGATLLSVGGHNIGRKQLHEVLQIIETLSPPITLTFSAAPPIYRPQKAAELATNKEVMAVHMGTWFPMPIMVHHPVSGGLNEVRYDGIHDAARRALRFLESLRAHGIETELKGLETVILPRTFLSGSGVHSGVIREGSGPFSDLPKGNWQAARMWFTFPGAKQIFVKRTDDGPFGLVPIRDGSDGSWIIVKAEPNGACAEAGISTSDTYILTHVNGVDTCPEIFRSLSPRHPGPATWQLAVLPHFEGAQECTLTLV